MTPRLRAFEKWFMMAVLLFFAATSLRAQHVLCVEYKGKPAMVRKVIDTRPYVLDGEKLVSASNSRSALISSKEFFPAFIAVRQMRVSTSHMEVMGSGSELNKEFHLSAEFESPFELANVFLVLELNGDRAGKTIFYYGVGDLAARKSRHIELAFPLSFALGEGKYELHLFSDGIEVFHSKQNWQYREGMLDRMVFKRIEGVKDAPPKPFIGPAPEYPAAFRKAGTKGEATVTVKLTPKGVVVDPAVQSATDPAFGEAALEAIRQWRFLPKISNGRPVETHVSMPFVFGPPDEKS